MYPLSSSICCTIYGIFIKNFQPCHVSIRDWFHLFIYLVIDYYESLICFVNILLRVRSIG